ncbi:hypothetical protein NEIELOOT_00398 [Neisseria elongata subsp. glycolytica ATCC 29315]|uniref:Uncharacterized protein n=1 Tax=Neisseria elongata subsp. glycolytica ATCC 29315 TaxID=546263 RepID=D4DMX4_NEIEG|nr:hypothetical protein NEIELOOT_00398 [Neisseria elongata subsp. glycolytica ATCC 29315]
MWRPIRPGRKRPSERQRLNRFYPFRHRKPIKLLFARHSIGLMGKWKNSRQKRQHPMRQPRFALFRRSETFVCRYSDGSLSFLDTG